MGKSYLSRDAFGPDDLGMLSGVYHDVCQRIEENGAIALTTQVRETIAVAVLDLAEQGIRDPERLWCRALSEVVTFNDVQTTLLKMASRKKR
jgi:hypothetical protein